MKPRYPKSDAPLEEWIKWYRWKVCDMDRLLQSAYRENDQLGAEARAEIERLKAENKQVRDLNELLADQNGSPPFRAYEAQKAEIERLRVVEKAAATAFKYHMLGYDSADDFDANTMLHLMDKLGAVLEPKPDLRALLPELAVIRQVMKEPKP
jgi:hypothetical protein